jgi:hypothetical protein
MCNPLLPWTAQVGREDGRMKWTNWINTFVVRAYYRITKLETDLTARRDQLHREFMDKYDAGTNATALTLMQSNKQ